MASMTMVRPFLNTLAVVGIIELYCCILAIHDKYTLFLRIDLMHGSKQHIHEGKLIGGVTLLRPSLLSLVKATLLSKPYIKYGCDHQYTLRVLQSKNTIESV